LKSGFRNWKPTVELQMNSTVALDNFCPFML